MNSYERFRIQVSSLPPLRQLVDEVLDDLGLSFFIRVMLYMTLLTVSALLGALVGERLYAPIEWALPIAFGVLIVAVESNLWFDYLNRRGSFNGIKQWYSTMYQSNRIFRDVIDLVFGIIGGIKHLVVTVIAFLKNEWYHMLPAWILLTFFGITLTIVFVLATQYMGYLNDERIGQSVNNFAMFLLLFCPIAFALVRFATFLHTQLLKFNHYQSLVLTIVEARNRFGTWIKSNFVYWILLACMTGIALGTTEYFDVPRVWTPVVLLGPLVLLSTIRYGSQNGMRWIARRILPFVLYTVLVVWFRDTDWWHNVRVNYEDYPEMLWIVSGTITLTITMIVWSLILIGRKFQDSVLVPIGIKILRLVTTIVFIIVGTWFTHTVIVPILAKENLELLLSRTAGYFAVGITTVVWITLFSQFWLENTAKTAGVINDDGTPIFNSKMQAADFWWPVVNRKAAIFQLLFRVHKDVGRGGYLYLLNPQITWRGGVIHGKLGLIGVEQDQVTSVDQFVDWLRVDTTGPASLGWEANTKIFAQLTTPGEDLSPTFLSWLLNMGKVKIQAISFGERDVHHNLPVFFRGSRAIGGDPIKKVSKWFKGERAFNWLWFAMQDAANTLRNHKQSVQTLEHRKPIYDQQQAERAAASGQRPRPYMGRAGQLAGNPQVPVREVIAAADQERGGR